MSEIQLDTLLEATLFGAGRSMTVSELCQSLGYDEEEMLDCLFSLRSTLKRRRGGALQIAEVGDRWAIEVKPEIASHLPKGAKTELPKKLPNQLDRYQPFPSSLVLESDHKEAEDEISSVVLEDSASFTLRERV